MVEIVEIMDFHLQCRDNLRTVAISSTANISYIV